MRPSIPAWAPLFAGIQPVDYPGLLQCLGAQSRIYEKGEIIFREGDKAEKVGMICSGFVQILRDDFTGARHIIARLGPGELFAEAFACAGTSYLPVSAVANERAEILLIGYRKILEVCPSGCAFHKRLIENMLSILAFKNVLLNQKIDVLSRRSIREKLIAYLSAQAKRAGGREFVIPFNRQELADYLCVDRSAMSAELSRLQTEGLLKTEKSRFWLSGTE